MTNFDKLSFRAIFMRLFSITLALDSFTSVLNIFLRCIMQLLLFIKANISTLYTCCSNRFPKIPRSIWLAKSFSKSLQTLGLYFLLRSDLVISWEFFEVFKLATFVHDYLCFYMHVIHYSQYSDFSLNLLQWRYHCKFCKTHKLIILLLCRQWNEI